MQIGNFVIKSYNVCYTMLVALNYFPCGRHMLQQWMACKEICIAVCVDYLQVWSFQWQLTIWKLGIVCFITFEQNFITIELGRLSATMRRNQRFFYHNGSTETASKQSLTPFNWSWYTWTRRSLLTLSWDKSTFFLMYKFIRLFLREPYHECFDNFE